MAATPQERLALGVAALLLAAGAAARMLTGGPAPAELAGPPAAEAGVSRLAAQVEDSVERAERRRAPLAPGERIDPNTAQADELDRLPGVGPALAEQIVERRASHGPFRTLADLDSVPGVGPAMLRNAAPHLGLRPAPAAPSARPPFQAADPVADLDRAPDKVTGRGAPASGGVVDVNTASADELATLPGIGPALAGRIVQWRAAHGRFGSAEALAEVPGIGPATVARLRARVRATP
ncbi:MAG TPA: helix-hairpin-helix domain-containing protein [Longimicrobium sp.]|nr:helix-hairpin-helix domain-containing protein [Longimicrobium sp.]